MFEWSVLYGNVIMCCWESIFHGTEEAREEAWLANVDRHVKVQWQKKQQAKKRTLEFSQMSLRLKGNVDHVSV